MCTAITYKTKDFYFGRTLDYEFSYGEEITVTPRNYEFHFREMGSIGKHYAMIGMAHVENAYPLYYDAVNEKGLGMAGLNFPGNAVYKKSQKGKENISTFELIPWILCQCGTVKEARSLLGKINITNTSFSEGLPLTELHWMIADQDETITVEAVKDGIFIYDNPAGVLTNNPPFPMQMFALCNYMHVSPLPAQNRFSDKLELKEYSRGMGALGLPGDLSSQSRFVRAAFTRLNAVSGDTEFESVSQFFHILGSVEQQRGCCDVGNGTYEITIYTACCSATKGMYYYTTYENHQISAVSMYRENLESSELIKYPLILGEQIRNQN
jgi:choloylglycine hydrolase